jgi:hypothetical protein
VSDLYKKLEEAADVVSGAVGVLELLGKRVKQLEGYLERYTAITDELVEWGEDWVLEKESHDDLIKLRQDIKRELGQ